MKAKINLDGWSIAVDWEAMHYSDSFFVPSINWRFDKRQIQISADNHRCQIKLKGVVEDGVAGIRVWCVTANRM